MGEDVRNLSIGDRVIIPSTIACGYCSYCRSGYYSQCDNANPNGKKAGTSFFGGPAQSGPIQGLQAEKALIPFAAANLVKIPDLVTRDCSIWPFPACSVPRTYRNALNPFRKPSQPIVPSMPANRAG